MSCLFLLASDSSASEIITRSSLAATSDRWFIWLLISSGIVALGCILEIGETVSSVRRWYRLKYRGIEEEENHLSWNIPASAIGLILVIVGVVGEGVCEGFLSTSETALRAYDERILIMNGSRGSWLEQNEVTFKIANALGPQNGQRVVIWYNTDHASAYDLADETYLTAYEMQTIFLIGHWTVNPQIFVGRANHAKGVFFEVSPRASAKTVETAERIAQLFADAPLHISPGTSFEPGKVIHKPGSLLQVSELNMAPLEGEKSVLPHLGDNDILIEVDPHP